MKTPDNNPLFTLTAEEVEIVKRCIEYLLRNPPFNAYGCSFQEESDLLNELKQWQDELEKSGK